MPHIKDKRVVITGGTNGIGFATAERFAGKGATVLVTGTSQKSVDRAIEQSQHPIMGVVCDLRDMGAIDALASTAKQELGGVDILFANAGIAHFRPIAEMTEALYDEVMDVNVKGLYFSIQKIVPLMSQGGVIVVTGSIAPRKGQDGLAVYGASKGAARAIVRNLAAEMIDRGIRINCLAPGPVETNIFARMSDGDEAKAQSIVDRLAAGVPIGRIGSAAEIAETVDYMCGPGAAYMMGSEITLDGGKSEL